MFTIPRIARIEPLELRIAPATLDLIGNRVEYRATDGVVNVLTVSVVGENYIFNESGETIFLTADAIAAGFTGSGTNTITAPDSAIGSLDLRPRLTSSETENTVRIVAVNDSLYIEADRIFLDGAVAAGPGFAVFSCFDFAQVATAPITAGSFVNLRALRAEIGAPIVATGGIDIDAFQVGREIVLGAELVSPSRLILTDAELDRLQTPGTLTIGGTLTGTISIQGLISPAGAGTLALKTPAGISQTGGAGIAVARLALDAGTSITLDGANDVDTLAAWVRGSGARQFSFTDADGFAVGSIGSVSGLRGEAGLAIRLNAGPTTQSAGAWIVGDSLELLGAGPFTLAEAGNGVGALSGFTTGGIAYTDRDALTIGTAGATSGLRATGGDITLTTLAGSVTVTSARAGADLLAGGTLTVSAGVPGTGPTIPFGVTVASGANVEAAGDIALLVSGLTLAGPVKSSSGRLSITPLWAGTAIALGGADGLETLGIDAAEFALLDASEIAIGSSMAGALTVSGALGGAGLAWLDLRTGSTISGSGVLSAGVLNLAAGSDVVLTGTQNVPDVQIEAPGLIHLAVSNSLNIIALNGGGAGISLTAGDTIEQLDAIVQGAGGGAVTLNAPNTVMLDNTDNDFTGVVSVTSGGDVLLADRNDLVLDATVIADVLALTVEGTTTQTGPFSGPGRLAFSSSTGMLVLSAANTYAGETTVNATLRVTGSTAATSAVKVGGLARVEGRGTVSGAVFVESGGTLDAAGGLTTGSVTLQPGANFLTTLATPASGSLSGVRVVGTANLGGAMLVLTSGLFGTGDTLVIVENDGTDAIVGTFAGLIEGQGVDVGGRIFTLSYAGGDGNDVTLTAAPAPVTISAQGKMATFRDVDGDLVTVKVTKGVLTADDFRLVPDGGAVGEAIFSRLDLTGGAFAGANVTITAKRGPAGGNGLVNVGRIEAAGSDLGTVTVFGDLGGIDAGDGDARKPALTSLTVGSLGGLGALTLPPGADRVSEFAGTLGKLTVRTDLRGASVIASGAISAVSVLGSIVGGQISAGTDLGAITVRGDIVGTAAVPVVISAVGKAIAPAKGVDLTLKSLTVAGGVEWLRVLAGYNAAGLGVNADASIGAISVANDWRTSTVLAGVGAGDDGLDGTADDARLAGSAVRDAATLVSGIATILIKGQAFGSATAGDAFGVVAETIGTARVGGAKLPFQKGPHTPGDAFAAAPHTPGSNGAASDFFLREAVL